jgi:hypothetical protein
MEFSNAEVMVLEATASEAHQEEARQLDEMQLAYVGGGNVIVTLG